MDVAGTSECIKNAVVFLTHANANFSHHSPDCSESCLKDLRQECWKIQTVVGILCSKIQLALGE